MGFLLSGAVNAAANGCDGVDVELDDRSPREHLCQEFLAVAVSFGVAELRGNDHPVRDIEVDVPGCKVFRLQLAPHSLR